MRSSLLGFVILATILAAQGHATEPPAAVQCILATRKLSPNNDVDTLRVTATTVAPSETGLRIRPIVLSEESRLDVKSAKLDFKYPGKVGSLGFGSRYISIVKVPEPAFEVEDSAASFSWFVSQNQLGLEIHTTKSLRVIWDSATFLDNNGKTHAVLGALNCVRHSTPKGSNIGGGMLVEDLFHHATWDRTRPVSQVDSDDALYESILFEYEDEFTPEIPTSPFTVILRIALEDNVTATYQFRFSK